MEIAYTIFSAILLLGMVVVLAVVTGREIKAVGGRMEAGPKRALFFVVGWGFLIVLVLGAFSAMIIAGSTMMSGSPVHP